jgi:hypothetical protein
VVISLNKNKIVVRFEKTHNFEVFSKVKLTIGQGVNGAEFSVYSEMRKNNRTASVSRWLKARLVFYFTFLLPEKRK